MIIIDEYRENEETKSMVRIKWWILDKWYQKVVYVIGVITLATWVAAFIIGLASSANTGGSV